jgi:hypothetical protein
VSGNSSDHAVWLADQKVRNKDRHRKKLVRGVKAGIITQEQADALLELWFPE